MPSSKHTVALSKVASLVRSKYVPFTSAKPAGSAGPAPLVVSETEPALLTELKLTVAFCPPSAARVALTLLPAAM